MNTTTTRCSACGTALTEPTLDGLCPKCLLTLGVATKIISVAGPTTQAPSGISWDGSLREPMDFGPYRVLRLLGQGGMGTVYEADDQRSGRRVALKVLGKFFDTAEMRQRFLREGQLAASVRHPNAVAVLAAEEIDGVAVIAMELVAGGTLRDRVKDRGPCIVTEAVETTLQIIDGLEEAHAHGVLHRDVKPANCFVGHDGTVKVGDFGLSSSTLTRQDAHLTQAGTILGTPAFASPEQLRGADVDVRSDIYAVGATLYFLLTGRPTHDAESLAALIAAVLEQTPAEPRSLRADVPRGLSRIVMRCLAKDPAARFSSYRDLREALQPFSATAPTPAMLGLRFAAGCIDLLLTMIPFLLWMVVTGDYPLDALLVARTPAALSLTAASMLWFVLYGALFEGVWGKTPGKAICGLRVVRVDNGLIPGMWRATARAFLFAAFPDLVRQVLVLAQTTGAEYEKQVAESVFLTADWVSFAIILALFATLRWRNGFAAVHDLLTGTRVVASASVLARPRLAETACPPPTLGAERIGPYVVVNREGDWIFGWDEVLRRSVWIRNLPPGTPPAAPVRRDLNRFTRLRWLNGHRSPLENWDAYEALGGTPLTARLDRRQPWSHVRFWAHDIANELAAAREDGTGPERAGASCLWLTDSGRAVLLEFPAPGSPPTATYDLRSSEEVQQFLNEIISSGVQPQLPLHASTFLGALRAHRFEAPGVVAGNLRPLLSRPAEVTFSRRLLGLALPVTAALFFSLAVLFMILHVNRDFDAMWHREFPGRESPRLALDFHGADMLPSGFTDHLAVYLAGHYGDVMRNSEFWNRPETIAVTFDSTREFAKNAMRQHPSVTPQRLEAANAAITGPLQELRRYDRSALIWSPPVMFILLLSILQLIAVLPAPWLKAPLGLRWLGLALVQKNGGPASALRIAVRCVISILPVAAGLIAALVLSSDPTVRPAWFVFGGSWVIMIVASAWTLLRPQRNPADLLAGTCLVTR
ncbi:MAG: protein kinase domain-containing protein [Verrucomicrobiales bacterium]